MHFICFSSGMHLLAFNVLLNPLCKLLWVQIFYLSNIFFRTRTCAVLLLCYQSYIHWLLRGNFLQFFFIGFINLSFEMQKSNENYPNFPTTDIFGIATIKILSISWKLCSNKRNFVVDNRQSETTALLFPLNPEIDLISLRSVHHPTEHRAQSKAAAAAHDRSQFLTFLLSTRSRQRRKLLTMEMISASSATMTDVFDKKYQRH